MIILFYMVIDDSNTTAFTTSGAAPSFFSESATLFNNVSGVWMNGKFQLQQLIIHVGNQLFYTFGKYWCFNKLHV